MSFPWLLIKVSWKPGEKDSPGHRIVKQLASSLRVPTDLKPALLGCLRECGGVSIMSFHSVAFPALLRSNWQMWLSIFILLFLMLCHPRARLTLARLLLPEVANSWDNWPVLFLCKPANPQPRCPTIPFRGHSHPRPLSLPSSAQVRYQIPRDSSHALEPAGIIQTSQCLGSPLCLTGSWLPSWLRR